MRLCQRLIDCNNGVEDFALAGGKGVKASLQTFLEILKDQGDKADIGDFVFWEGFADKFGPQSSEMHHRRTADEGPEEADHEVDRMIGGQDAEVAKVGSERIERGERNALFHIIFVSHHAALGAAASAGGIHDRCYVLTCAR